MVDKKSSASGFRIGRGAWIGAGLVAIIAVLIVYRLRSTPFAWGLFFATFMKVDWRWSTAVVALLLLSYFGRALRWEVMLRPMRKNTSLWGITSATVIGFTALVLLGRAGELVRPYLIAVKERVTFSSQMAVLFLERIFDLLFVLLIFGVALARMPGGQHLTGPLQWVLHTGGYFIASIGAGCILLLIAFRNFADLAQRRILQAVSFLPQKLTVRIQQILEAFVKGTVCIRDGRSLTLIVLYTGLEWIIIVAAHYCIFKGMKDTEGLGLNDVLVFIGFVAFGSVVQIPGIGGGVQVAAALVLTQLFHIAAEPAAALAILIWILSWVVVVPFGLAFAFHEGVNWKKISHLSDEVDTGAGTVGP